MALAANKKIPENKTTRKGQMRGKKTDPVAAKEALRLRSEERLGITQISEKTGISKASLSPILKPFPLTPEEIRKCSEPTRKAKLAQIRREKEENSSKLWKMAGELYNQSTKRCDSRIGNLHETPHQRVRTLETVPRRENRPSRSHKSQHSGPSRNTMGKRPAKGKPNCETEHHRPYPRKSDKSRALRFRDRVPSQIRYRLHFSRGSLARKNGNHLH